MKHRPIPDSDSLFRHCIHPRSFKGKRFAEGKLLYLEHDKERGTLLGSLAWQRYVPTTKHVHAYGCRVASRTNEKWGAEGKLEKHRHIYCGAYRLNGSSARALATADALDEISSADVVHRTENGEIAHTDLRICLRPGDLDIPGTKTAIVDRLWRACSGPLKYTAVSDKDIDPHPSAFLDPGPDGAYSDTRSYLCRLWSLIRFQMFQMYMWLGRHFCQNQTK
jgi:hypothetical protein